MAMMLQAVPIRFALHECRKPERSSTMNSFLYSLKKDIENQENLLKDYRKKAAGKYSATITGFTSHKKTYFKIATAVEIDGKTHHKQKTLRKSEEQIVEKHAEQALAQRMVEIMEHNLSLQKRLLVEYRPYSFRKVLETLSQTYQCIDFEENPLRKAAKFQEESATKGFRTDNLTQPTSFGLRVRSKSEAIIANMLAEREIPFVYEAELINLHPDFTILLPNGEKIIWEHLGLLSDESYVSSLTDKIMLYHNAGYNINSNFFITTDTQDGRLDMDAVMNVLSLISQLL